MQEKLLNALIRFNQRPFIQVVRHTLLMLFPISLIGSIARMILRSCLEDDGFFYNILMLDVWAPTNLIHQLQLIFYSITQVIFGLLGVIAIYLVGRNTAHYYHKDAQMAGITSIVTLLLLAFRYGAKPANGMDFRMSLLSGHSLLFALLLGYAVGLLFRWLGPDEITTSPRWDDLRSNYFASLKPLLIACTCAVIIAWIINSGTFYSSYSKAYKTIIAAGEGSHNFALTLLALIGFTLMDWLGLGVPYISNLPLETGYFADNLNYALAHGSAWNVPHPLMGGTLYNSFANFGGDGLVLALIVALLIWPNNNNGIQRVARWSALPTMFNFDYSSLVGLPIIMNPVFLLPFLFLPIINLLLAAGAILLHIIPSTPYQVLLGTPGPLISFLATNGDWRVLIFTLVLLLIDILAYVPFVKLNYQVEAKLTKVEIGGEQR